MRWIQAMLLIVVLAGCGEGGFTAPAARVRAAELELSDANDTFHVFGRIPLPDGTFEPLFSFDQSKLEVVDLAPRWDDCVYGSSHFEGGDRVAYHTAWFFYAHQDPGQHEHINAIRVMVQNYGPLGFQLNDKYMSELFPQGLAPYPYERETVEVDKSRPGGVVEIFHNRPTQYDQKLAEFVIPEVSPKNPKVKWYYQLGGLFVAVHDDHGPIARVIVTSMLPHYAYRVQGVTTGGLKVGPQNKVNALIASCPAPGS